MKKIIYLAPLALLGLGVKASANQVPTHISNALRVYEQESKQNQPVGQSENERSTCQAKPSLPNGQNQLIGKGKEAAHISRLDDGLINEDSSVESGQANQVMNISRTAIPTKQELSESKDSIAGQYVQVQQNRVAQFNKGSQIYGLNNSGQLSKNNGDGYVITNAGTYNGRAVDIAITINNVSEQQGNYTTKWSNGDEADITGKTDANFKYDNSALPSAQQNAVHLTQTRLRNETQNVTEPFPYTIIMHGRHDFDYGTAPETGDIDITGDVLHYCNSNDLNSGLAEAIANGAYRANGTKCLFMSSYYYGDDEDEDAKLNEKFINRLSKLSSGGRLTVGDVEDGDDQDTYTVYGSDKVSIIKIPDTDVKYTHKKKVSVTDHLQMVNQS